MPGIDLQGEVNRTVQGFVAQIVELVRHAALETLQSAFATPAAAGSAARARERAPDPAGPSPRRTPADLDTLSRRLTACVAAHPGLRITEIKEQLGTTTKDLALPIRKLLSDGAIRTRGRKRSTRYFAAGAPAAASSSPPEADAQAQAVAQIVERAVDRAGGAGVAPLAGPLSAGPPDADWYRCLAGVFTLAQRLHK